MVGSDVDVNYIYEHYFLSGVKESLNNGDFVSKDESSFDFNKKYGNPCSAARTECALDPEGNLYPCRVFMSEEMKCGNVFNNDIEDIWRNSKILAQIGNLDFMKIDECGECSFLRICLGGCRGIAYIESGSLYSCANSFSCALRKKIMTNIISKHALNAFIDINK